MKTNIIDQTFLDKKIPHRNHFANKNDFGRVTAVCGSRGYTGAAYFATQAAVKTGSGVVTLFVPASVYQILALKLNEAVVYPAKEDEKGQFLKHNTNKILSTAKNGVLIGPGIGRGENATKTVLSLVEKSKVPIVLDADGINSITGNINVLSKSKYPVILTPHEGEFLRLIGKDRVLSREDEAIEFAQKYNCIVLLKGHRTVVASYDGTIMINSSGNPGMAKGGSGDILSGVILSLIGQGLEPFEATACGAFIHGKAGDLAANSIGEYGMTPTDMLDLIPQVLRRYNSKEW